MAKLHWKDLSPRTRRLVVAVAVIDAGLKAAALVDIKRRPAGEIRGPKRVWVPVVAIVNSAGVIPLSYFAFGRRRPGASPDG
jgi:hypothetical protein